MRKENSEFKTAFISHEGTTLHNNDYFAFMEQDKLACYILADGIETGDESQSARIAAEAVAAAFNEHPSMTQGAIRKYLMAAHKRLKINRRQLSMKASITVVVTDYTTLRFGYVGNTRFHLYRGGQLLLESRDHSVSWSMMEEDELPKDKIARHEERGNLTRYLGQEENLVPDVSKKIKLKEGDIFTLFTRGIWETIDSYDLQAVFEEAGREPEETVQYVERLILDAHPEEIDNYTFASIFVNKTYIDPHKGKKIKKILKIVIPVLLILLILGVTLFIRHRIWLENKQNMDLYYLSGIEYIQDNNFVRAKEELSKASALAVKVKDISRRDEIAECQKLIDAVMESDELLEKAAYEEALKGYLRARGRSRYADHLAERYIANKLELTKGYINVFDMLNLGDQLKDQGNYALAEEKYLAARLLASQIYDAGGRDKAITALNDLYTQMEKEAVQEKEESKERSQQEIAAADFIIQGDNAFKEGDIVGARMYYTMAKEKYSELGNKTVVASIDKKLALVEDRQKENEERLIGADRYIEEGEDLFDQKKYADAKKQYLLAREIYADLREDSKLEKTQTKIEIVDGYLTGSESVGNSEKTDNSTEYMENSVEDRTMSIENNSENSTESDP
ncbi:MAG: protein phosphatase 2C domain-containing protein [Hungatella sp.]|jgi:serine/threonine protein phosphatase PrpC|nr:protein phosphatase 2C domain-containing protein [Hungatella sp.]